MAWIYCLMYCNDIPQKTLKFFFNIFTVSHIIYLIFTTKVLLNWEIWTLCIIFHDLNLRVLLEVQVLLFNRLHWIGNLFLDPEHHYQFMNLTSWKNYDFLVPWPHWPSTIHKKIPLGPGPINAFLGKMKAYYNRYQSKTERKVIGFWFLGNMKVPLVPLPIHSFLGKWKSYYGRCKTERKVIIFLVHGSHEDSTSA